MKVYQLSGPPSPAQSQALAEFEKPFTYPLGPGRFFRISHGEDYTLFFRAQGNGACFIAEDEGRVVGALGTAIRPLWMPDGTERSMAYFGDLKIAPAARGGAVLLRLARAAEARLRPKVDAGFGVVMGGTSLMPENYTGRAGIPPFEELGRLVVLRVSGAGKTTGVAADVMRPIPGQKSDDFPPPHVGGYNFLRTTAEAGLDCYRRLSRGRYACPAGDAQARSQIAPVWLMHPDGLASGMLEDTRKAKRLIIGDGSELLSAHLSCFAYSTVSAGAELIKVALREAASLGLPALFLAVAEPDAEPLRASLPDLEIVAAPASVYGTGLQPGLWNINTSEI